MRLVKHTNIVKSRLEMLMRMCHMCPTLTALATACTGNRSALSHVTLYSLHTKAKVLYTYRSDLFPPNSVVNLFQNGVGVLADVSSPHLPVTPAQLTRPSIGRNASCAVGDFV